MSYESRLYIVNVNDNDCGHAECIAMVNMSCMEIGFRNLFRLPVSFEMWAMDSCYDEQINIDKYGDEVMAAEISDVISYLKKSMYSPYRRIRPLLGLLEGFDQYQWDHLLVVHYGY